MRRIVLLTVISLFVGSMGAPTPVGASHGRWCSSSPPPCVETATLDGLPVLSTDPTWDVSLILFTGAGSNDLLWRVDKAGSPGGFGDASLDDDWVIRINAGTVIPRVAFTHGKDVTVTREDHGDGTYHITIAATPVIISSQCVQSGWPWTCPPPSPSEEWIGYLDGQVTDYAAWDNVAQRKSFYGMDYNSNIAATSLPPEIEEDPLTAHQRLLIRLANAHSMRDGTTFVGFAHLRIPNLFLKRVHGIDDPGSLTTAGLSTSFGGTGGGTATVSEEPSGTAMIVDITGMTFSARKVRIRRGKVTPTRPTDLRARRVDADTGRLRFGRATKRGSRIVGYQGRCVNDSDVIVANGSGSPLTIHGLTPGMRYRCRVRARSKAGPGTWSVRDAMPA